MSIETCDKRLQASNKDAKLSLPKSGFQELCELERAGAFSLCRGGLKFPQKGRKGNKVEKDRKSQ